MTDGKPDQWRVVGSRAVGRRSLRRDRVAQREHPAMVQGARRATSRASSRSVSRACALLLAAVAVRAERPADVRHQLRERAERVAAGFDQRGR